MSFNAGSTIARASSGSRSCSSSVEPLISANNAVTVLRSPSRFSPSGVSVSRVGAEAGCLVAGEVPSAVPHSPQNLLPAGFSAPHLRQRFASGVPQSPQNFLPAGFSIPHFEQSTCLSHAPYEMSSIVANRYASQVRGTRAAVGSWPDSDYSYETRSPSRRTSERNGEKT